MKKKTTLYLKPPAVTHIGILQARTGRNQTDIIHKALQLYHTLHEHKLLGGEVHLKRGDETLLLDLD